VAEFPRQNWSIASVKRLLHHRLLVVWTLDPQTANRAVVDVALRALTRTLMASKIVWKNDWLKTGVTLIRTLLTEQQISGVTDCV